MGKRHFKHPLVFQQPEISIHSPYNTTDEICIAHPQVVSGLCALSRQTSFTNKATFTCNRIQRAVKSFLKSRKEASGHDTDQQLNPPNGVAVDGPVFATHSSSKLKLNRVAVPVPKRSSSGKTSPRAPHPQAKGSPSKQQQQQQQSCVMEGTDGVAYGAATCFFAGRGNQKPLINISNVDPGLLIKAKMVAEEAISVSLCVFFYSL